MAELPPNEKFLKMRQICIWLLHALILMVLSIDDGTLVMATHADHKRYNRQVHHRLMSPPEESLRQTNPLDEMPFVELIETPNIADDPRSGDLNNTALRIKLGSDFDDAIMSVLPPLESEHRNLAYYGLRRSKLDRLIPTGRKPDFLTKIDFKHLRFSQDSKIKTKISSKLKREIQQFLWAYTACPVIYRWRDLGIRFWPRYLKDGYCQQDVSCSIPPGMYCRPSASTYKTILRWYCKSHSSSVNTNSFMSNRDVNSVTSSTSYRHCQWIRVDLPVLTECSCACSPTESDNF